MINKEKFIVSDQKKFYYLIYKKKKSDSLQIGKLLKKLTQWIFLPLVYFALNRYNAKLTMVSMEALLQWTKFFI